MEWEGESVPAESKLEAEGQNQRAKETERRTLLRNEGCGTPRGYGCLERIPV